jgi:hypothetical protein
MDTHDIDNEIDLALIDVKSQEEDSLMFAKVRAILTLHSLARSYRNENFPEEKIVHPIIQKKIAFIKAAESKKQIKEILKLTKVHYSGGEVRPIGPYAIPEEELAIWSRTSLNAGAPLIAPAAKRYTELFLHIFPELSEEIGL